MRIKTRVAGIVVASASAVALMGAPAFANTGPVSGGNGSILGGTQIIAPVTVPITVCGNAIAILGIANSQGCRGDASVRGPIASW